MGGDEELVTGYVVFEMLIWPPRRDMWQLVGFMSLEIRGEAKVKEVGPREC